VTQETEQFGPREMPPGVTHGGWLAAKILKQEGVDTVFTLSGGHISALYDGCLREGIRVIDTRHEQSAVHAAEGYARVTGKPGVALLTAGPGVTDGVTGIANAFQAPSPVVVLAGRSPLSEEGMGGLQEMDQVGLVRPITKWAKTAYETKRIPALVAEAFRHATAGRPGPVFLDIPFDILSALVPDKDIYIPQSGYRVSGNPAANPEQIQQAADLLASAEHPVIMAGGAVWWSQGVSALHRLVETLQIPVYLNGMGRGLFRHDHPLFFSLSRKQALQNADVAFVIGTPLDFRLNFGKVFGSATKIIWLDLDAREIGHNRPATVGIVADVRLALESLHAALDGKTVPDARREWVAGLREAEKAAYAKDEPLMNSDANPIHSMRLVRELRDVLDPDATIVADGGDIVTFGARVLRVNHAAHWLDPGQMGCLGVGPGFAIAAALARPGKQVVLLMGDGSFGLNGMDFETFVRYNLPITVVIGNDGAWGQIMRPQVQMLGHPTAGMLAPGIRYDKVAEAFGGHGEFVTEPSEIRPALERALKSGKPSLVNVVTDPKIGYARSSVIGL
jgi:acetolactate synthase I/II/III large subunit